MKNIEWVKNKIDSEVLWAVNDREDPYFYVNVGLKMALDFLDQLDEPEVLTQEWIDKNVIHVRGLGDIIEAEAVENIIVSNQEITYEDAIKVIAENIDTDEFSVGLYIEALNNNEKYEFLTEKWIEDNTSPVDEEGRLSVWKRDLQNVIVPKQELPVVIPKYVDDWITKHRDTFDLYRALKELEDNTLGWELTYKWYRTNTHKFVNAYLTGEYEVKDEPQYYALIKGHELIDSGKVYWIHDKNNDDVFISVLHSPSDNFLAEMSKVEWNRLGINDSNADFIKVAE